MKKSVLTLIFLLGISWRCSAQMISCAQASSYVGMSVTVCGQVKSAMRDSLGKRSGMVLALCLPYPHQPLMIVIKDDALPLFAYDETTWPGKQICVSGLISLLSGRPYIEVRKRTQIVD